MNEYTQAHICKGCKFAEKHYDIVTNSIITTNCTHWNVFDDISTRIIITCGWYKVDNSLSIEAKLTRKVEVEWYKVEYNA